MNDVTTQDIELTITEADEIIALDAALTRLEANADFQKVILEGYFKDEPIRLVGLKGAPQVQTEAAQASIVKSIDGVGCLQQYFNTLVHNAIQAERAKEDAHEALAEMAEEGEI